MFKRYYYPHFIDYHHLKESVYSAWLPVGRTKRFPVNIYSTAAKLNTY